MSTWFSSDCNQTAVPALSLRVFVRAQVTDRVIRYGESPARHATTRVVLLEVLRYGPSFTDPDEERTPTFRLR
jgi:hypothetical protein